MDSQLLDSQLLSERLLAHLGEVARDRDPLFSPLGHLCVRAYIREQLCTWGAVIEEEFDHAGQTYCNLYLDLPGQEPGQLSQSGEVQAAAALAKGSGTAQPCVWVGAHYDAVRGSPGADDNATGVAVLLELARVFAGQPAPLPLRLVAFDGEEYGRLGSQLAARHAVGQGENIRLMLSLEMLGYCSNQAGSQRYPTPLQRFYPDTGNFIALVGNLRTLPQLWRWRRQFHRVDLPCQILPVWNRGLTVPRTRDSDHAAFWDAGYSAVLVTDTADLRNPNYHRESDRIETLDLTFLRRVAEGLIQSLRQLR